MKKVMIVLILLTGITALAQKEKRVDVNRRGLMKNLTPEQTATLKAKKMTLVLDLSEKQQEQIKAMQIEHIKMHQAEMKKRKVNKEKGVKLSSEEHFKMANANLDRKIAEKVRMKEILSAEQYEKWKKMSHKKGRQRKGARKRHKKNSKK